MAVFDSDPVAEGLIVACTEYVTFPSDGTLTVSLMLPVPEAVQLALADGVHVYVAAVMAGGKESVTVAPTTVSVPWFVTSIV